MSNKNIVLVAMAAKSNRTAEENLGLGYLASFCRKNGYSVEVIDGWMEELFLSNILERIMNGNVPLLLGLSVKQLNKEDTLSIISSLKKCNFGAPIVVGGVYPTFHPEEFLKGGCDVVVRSEGEQTLLSLCRYFEKGEPDLSTIKGINYLSSNKQWCQTAPAISIKNLDELPFPSRETMMSAINKKVPVNVLSSRGCYGHCVFCSVVAFWRQTKGAKWRQRSISNLVDELEHLHELGVSHIKIVDDSFIEPPRDGNWCARFADEIEHRKLNLSMRISLRADLITEKIVSELCRAGCTSVACGIESFNDTALQRMNKSSNSEQNKKALDILNSHNMYVQMGFILFDWETTFDELFNSYRMIQNYSWVITKGIFTEMYAAKGTNCTTLLQTRGLLQSQQHKIGNYLYETGNLKVRIIYKALKTWHQSHMKVYDMAIDPISKPKALSREGYEMFYKLYQKLIDRDLKIMGSVLELVQNGKNEIDLSEYVSNEVSNSCKWYSVVEKELRNCYNINGLEYNAIQNPFCS